MVFNTQDLSEFVPPEVLEDIKGEDRAHIGPELGKNICACTGREIQKLVLNIPDQDNKFADYPELFDENGQPLSGNVGDDKNVFHDYYKDPVTEIIVETFLAQGDEGLQDLVVIKPENGIVGNHGKMRPRTCPRKMR